MNFPQQLRAVAQWFEEHPGAPTPELYSFNVFNLDAKRIAAYRRSIGNCTKYVAGKYFYLRVAIPGTEVLVDWNFSRSDICERRQVGERIIPATPARVEPVFEWDCPPTISDLADGT